MIRSRSVWVAGALLLAFWLLAAVAGCQRQSSQTGQATPAAVAKAPQAAPVEAVKGTRASVGEGEDKITVLHVWGTPYEMGYAQGKLCAAEIKGFYGRLLGALGALGKKPEDLDGPWAQMAPHVPQRYLEEMRGLAEGAGVDLKTVQRGHAVPDVSEWDCTFFAAWGGFTANKHLLQLRALDYATEWGIQEQPAIIVYSPDKGVAHVTVGWCGFVGTVTGMNAEGVAMSEIGDDFDKATETFEGEPMPFVMRDVLYDAKTVAEGVGIVKRATRTLSYLYLIGSGRENTATALKTGHTVFETFTASTLPFPRFENAVYMSMGFDSDWNQKVHGVLAACEGKLTPELAEEKLMKGLGTGDLHSVLFDATDRKLWVANATPEGKPAYDQKYVAFDFAAALQEAPPTTAGTPGGK